MTFVEGQPGTFFRRCGGPVNKIGHGAGDLCWSSYQERFGPGD
jgi:hypothetical protein